MRGVGKSSEADGQPSGAPVPVFISYASQDAAVANSIVQNLEQHGCKCWIAPRDVTPGSQYADEIVGAINDARVFVLVLSEHAACLQKRRVRSSDWPLYPRQATSSTANP